jgi:ATP-dependent RNA helicase DDX20
MSNVEKSKDADRKNKPIKQRTKDIELNENVKFDDLMLSKPLLIGLKAAGFIKPSPIQFKAIPLGKLGLGKMQHWNKLSPFFNKIEFFSDLIVQAKSGTGKTCVFSVIALENMIAKSNALQVLILAPTREVALQITGVLKKISVSMKLKCFPFIGGQPLNEDLHKLKHCQIAVGTPGTTHPNWRGLWLKSIHGFR